MGVDIDDLVDIAGIMTAEDFAEVAMNSSILTEEVTGSFRSAFLSGKSDINSTF
jgi:hypothetical protein